MTTFSPQRRHRPGRLTGAAARSAQYSHGSRKSRNSVQITTLVTPRVNHPSRADGEHPPPPATSLASTARPARGIETRPSTPAADPAAVAAAETQHRTRHHLIAQHDRHPQTRSCMFLSPVKQRLHVGDLRHRLRDHLIAPNNALPSLNVIEPGSRFRVRPRHRRTGIAPTHHGWTLRIAPGPNTVAHVSHQNPWTSSVPHGPWTSIVLAWLLGRC